ncbi:TrmH family RNA methyltransferase [Candidatus Gottesmanbacteria bacterium]|nr:TrmH family RNA methyltransferase [Candidatus Gottesmanbacteria bacterium]
MKLNAKALRNQERDEAILAKIKRNPIYIVLDNVLDTYNVGSLFRLADAVAARQILLCGNTETPPNTRIKKASINTWQWVEWKYAPTAVEAISNIKNQISNIQIIAVEQHHKSISLKEFRPEFPVAVVVGNETFGVSKEVLNMADTIVELPMFGVNKSLNVMVSCGIVLYKIVEYL